MSIPRPGVISVKVTFWVSLVVVTIVATHIYVTRPERRFFEQKMMESSRIAQIIESHLLAEMMGGEPDNIQRHMEMLPEVAGIHSVEIVNPELRVRFSTDSTRVGLQVDRASEESCQHCHSQNPIPNRAVYEHGGVGRVFAVDRVLTNDQRCQECHAEDGPILGNILVEVALTEHDMIALAARRRLMLGGTLSLAVMLLGMGAIIQFLVGRPTNRLLGKMRRVRHGDFDVGAPVPSKDEFGALEAGFHDMVERLRGLYTDMETMIQERTHALYETRAQVLHQEKLANIGQLAAGVAHEIGNPLTAIDSIVQLLEVESADPAVRERTRLIQEQVNRISTIVHSMSDLSRPLSMEERQVDVNAVIRSVVELSRHDARFRAIDIRTQIDESIPKVRTTEDRLFGACLNLVINAGDAMPDGGSLDIETRTCDGGVEIVFRDTGVGMDAETLGRVFEPYFSTKGGSGTGLGLSLCHTYFESVGGSIRAESEPGTGTTFYTHLSTDAEPGPQAPT